MSKKKSAVIQLLALLFIYGLIIWHVIHWHAMGIYLEMFKWLQMGRSYITVLYNLGLMLVLGTVSGILTERITNLIGYKENDK